MKIYFGLISSIPALPEAISLRAATVHLSISLFILSPEPGEICLARTEAAIVSSNLFGMYLMQSSTVILATVIYTNDVI